jgi:hypothetical protein
MRVMQHEFLATFVAQTADSVLQQGRKIMSYGDVASQVDSVSCLEFLLDIIPKKVTAAQAVARAAPL